VGLFASKAEKRTKAISDFWSWFVANRGRFEDTSHVDMRAIKDLGTRLNKIEEGLTFQIGAPESGSVIEISADGIRDRFPSVRQVVAAAPSIPGWRVVAFRQPAENVADLQLEFHGQSISPNDITFVARSSGSRASVVLYVPTSEKEVSRDLIGAAFILLDATLGEYAVETKVQIDGFLPKSEQPDEARALPELVGLLDDVPGDPI
jgi:hypothetical protein